jgi:uncharacterized protein
VKRSLSAARSALVAVFLLPLRVYRVLISPALPRRCKYEPTCSAYAEQAIRELGLVRGTILAGWRVVRCNPWSHGGYDPVEARTIFRPSPAGEEADPPAAAARTSGGVT